MFISFSNFLVVFSLYLAEAPLCPSGKLCGRRIVYGQVMVVCWECDERDGLWSFILAYSGAASYL